MCKYSVFFSFNGTKGLEFHQMCIFLNKYEAKVHASCSISHHNTRQRSRHHEMIGTTPG